MSDTMQPTKPRLVVYSNRPPVDFNEKTGEVKPNLKGGAVRVILESPVSVWVGPGRTVPDEEYARMSDEEKFPSKPIKRIDQDGKLFDVYAFPVPKSLKEAQYNVSSNRWLWPIHHSMEPEVFENPLVAMHRDEPLEEKQFSMDLQTAERTYMDYKRFNAIGSEYLERLRHTNQPETGRPVIEANDQLWVHDYQCANVGQYAFPDRIFSYHIPWPSLSYLSKVLLPERPLEPGEKDDGQRKLVPLLNCPHFQDYVKTVASSGLVTFQRPCDQENFLETLAYFDRNMQVDHAALFHEQPDEEGRTVAEQPLGHDSVTVVQAFGKENDVAVKDLEAARNHDGKGELALKQVREEVYPPKRFGIMNYPVGTSQALNLREAKEYEGIFAKDFDEKAPESQLLSITKLRADRLALAGIDNLKAGQIRSSVPNSEKDPTPVATTTLGQLLGSMMTEPGHEVFFSVHRNDYTKCTMEKLEAAQHFLEHHLKELHRPGAPKVHFVFVLEQTRTDIPEYQDYEARVLEYAKALRKRFGDAITVIPQGISHGEVMGVLRQPNVIGLLGIGQKDGHDLTLREAVDAQADIADARIAAITTHGTGASDVLQGAFAIEKPDRPRDFIDGIAKVCWHIHKMNATPEGREELHRRHAANKEASEYYSGQRYGQEISAALASIANDNPPRAIAGTPNTRLSEANAALLPEPMLGGRAVARHV